jgi:cytoplasmic iron level regulating protein YaaA (DUF328/UPF0246 family)
MVRYAIDKKVASVKKLEGFNADGYQFNASASKPDRLVFQRKLA